MRIRIALICALGAALASCSGGTPYPSGWQPAPGASPGTMWVSGSGPSQQSYSFAQAAYAGTLQDLGTSEAAAVPKRYQGALFDNSDTFAACPGVAAVATFRYGADRVLMEGYAVQSGKSTIVTYVRPLDIGMGPDVESALEKALCTARS